MNDSEAAFWLGVAFGVVIGVWLTADVLLRRRSDRHVVRECWLIPVDDIGGVIGEPRHVESLSETRQN